MCDYSLTALMTRDAVVGDKLVTRNFGTGSIGFSSTDETSRVAVCVRPGTELAFDAPIKVHREETKHHTAIFRQINKDRPHMHHDVVELPDGRLFLLTFLPEGQRATVLQLPIAPRNEAEVEEQRRAEVVG